MKSENLSRFHASTVVYAAMALVCALPAPALAQKDGGGKGPSAMRVAVDVVRTEPLIQTSPVIGRLAPRRAGVVAARTNGPVEKFTVEIGDYVRAGETIAVLESNALQWKAKLKQAETAEREMRVRTAEKRVALRRQALERVTKLKNSAAFSQAALDDRTQEVVIAESEIAEQRAALRVAQAHQRLAEIDLANAVIKAPYSGAVIQRHTEAGAYVTAGAAIVSMIDIESLEIEADAPIERIGGLTPGAEVTFRLADGAVRQAQVRAVTPDENPLTRTRRVRFTADFTGAAALAANQSATVNLPAGAPRIAVTAHKDAVLNRGGKTVVYVVSAENKAELRPVTLGEAIGARFEVITGLRPGEKIVVRGNERLRPGQAVNIGGEE
ncbi:MAG: efflux RND transporter periplasmic adaptor subunit [Rhodospirillales bacterium]